LFGLFFFRSTIDWTFVTALNLPLFGGSESLIHLKHQVIGREQPLLHILSKTMHFLLI